MTQALTPIGLSTDHVLQFDFIAHKHPTFFILKMLKSGGLRSAMSRKTVYEN